MTNPLKSRFIAAALIFALTAAYSQPAFARTAPTIKYVCQDYFSNQVSEGAIPLKQCGSVIRIAPYCEGSRVLLSGEGENHSIGVRFQLLGELSSPAPKTLDHFHLSSFKSDHSKEANSFGNYNSVSVKTGSVMSLSAMGISNQMHSYGTCTFIFSF